MQRFRATTKVLPSLHLKINQRGLEPDLHKLYEIHIENLSRFDNLEVSQKTKTNIVIFSAAAMATIFIFGSIVAFVITMIRRSSKLKGEKLQETPIHVTVTPTTSSVSCSKTAGRLNHKCCAAVKNIANSERKKNIRSVVPE